MIARAAAGAALALATLAPLHALAQVDDPGRVRGPGSTRRSPTDEEKERARLSIGMTRDQQSQLEAVFDDSGKQMRAVFDGLRERHRKLSEVYDAYDIDEGQAEVARKGVLELRKKMLQVQAATEKRVRKILTREQFERMRALMHEEAQKRRRARTPGDAPPGPPRP